MARRKRAIPTKTGGPYLASQIRDRFSSTGLKVIRLARWMRVGKMK